jgi:hypothetical protein
VVLLLVLLYLTTMNCFKWNDKKTFYTPIVSGYFLCIYIDKNINILCINIYKSNIVF